MCCDFVVKKDSVKSIKSENHHFHAICIKYIQVFWFLCIFRSRRNFFLHVIRFKKKENWPNKLECCSREAKCDILLPTRWPNSSGKICYPFSLRPFTLLKVQWFFLIFIKGYKVTASAICILKKWMCYVIHVFCFSVTTKSCCPFSWNMQGEMWRRGVLSLPPGMGRCPYST